MVSKTTIIMRTHRDAQSIKYSVEVEHESDDVLEKTVVWEKEVVFMGDRKDGPRARIAAREQEKVASEQQRKWLDIWEW